MLSRRFCYRKHAIFAVISALTPDYFTTNYSLLDTSDDSKSGFQFRYDIDTIFKKYRDMDIDILKMISM